MAAFLLVRRLDASQQISDDATIEKMIGEVIAASPKQLEQYRAGKTTIIESLKNCVIGPLRRQVVALGF